MTINSRERSENLSKWHSIDCGAKQENKNTLANTQNRGALYNMDFDGPFTKV